jgi:hypothetical protein
MTISSPASIFYRGKPCFQLQFFFTSLARAQLPPTDFAARQNKPRRASSRHRLIPVTHLCFAALETTPSLAHLAFIRASPMFPAISLRILFSLHRNSTFFAMSYLIFMGFLLVVEIGK